jgi:hypothetical protein
MVGSEKMQALFNPYGNCVEHREKPKGKGCEALQEKARKGRAKIR